MLRDRHATDALRSCLSENMIRDCVRSDEELIKMEVQSSELRAVLPMVANQARSLHLTTGGDRSGSPIIWQREANTAGS